MLKASPAIQALKPVMMMSPLSVAQFLIPGKQTFDLLVMDEASQINLSMLLGRLLVASRLLLLAMKNNFHRQASSHG
jgi:superfamily I DNA and/or RNA helicase